MKKSGFTIWELLAVIIIIIFLVLILFPVGLGHHEKARQVACSSNMKQIGLAISEYAQDNDGSLPNIADAKNANVTWRTMVYPYVKNKALFLCPDHDSDAKNPDGFAVSYAANFTGDYSGGKDNQGDGAFAGAGSYPLHRNNIEKPDWLIMLCEVSHTDRPDFNIDALGALAPDSNILWAGHTEGSNYLFADGHMKYFHAPATKDWWHRDSSSPLSAGSVKILQSAEQRGGK